MQTTLTFLVRFSCQKYSNLKIMVTHPLPTVVDNTYTTFPGLHLLQTLWKICVVISNYIKEVQYCSKTAVSKLVV